MGSRKFVTQIKLIVRFIAIFVISLLTGFTQTFDTQACLPNYIQTEFYEGDEEDIKGDNLQSSYLKKSIQDNSICPVKNAIILIELFHSRKFWLSSSSPRPPPEVYKFHRNFSHYPVHFLHYPDRFVNQRNQ
jgi:hypothetical protein